MVDDDSVKDPDFVISDLMSDDEIRNDDSLITIATTDFGESYPATALITVDAENKGSAQIQNQKYFIPINKRFFFNSVSFRKILVNNNKIVSFFRHKDSLSVAS